MADRIIKGDSGNDVIIQNNAGSRKIEVTNSGDVEVTGDVKTTTVKATNLKANDGTASLVVADSTGEVTSSGGLKAVNLKTTNLKANDGTAGISIADSTGRLTVTESDPVITIGVNALSAMKYTVGAIKFADFNPADNAGAYGVPGSITSSLDNDFISIGSISSGTVTITLDKAGRYSVISFLKHAAAHSYTTVTGKITYGGTCTRLFVDTTFESGNSSNQDFSMSCGGVLTATATQTLTVKIEGNVNNGGGASNHTYSSNLQITYCGNA